MIIASRLQYNNFASLGLPDHSCSVAKTAQNIIEIFQNYPKATHAIVCMAQPLHVDATAQCITLFGTDNKFSNEDVRNRLYTLKSTLSSVGFEILTYAADGDPRETKFMRQLLTTGLFFVSN